MSGRETAARIADLRRRLDDASHRYHVLDDPDIPDAEYDAMLRELDELEAAHPEFADPNSPTQRVGFAASGRFEPVAHAVPMLSLANAFTDEEVADFVARIFADAPQADDKTLAAKKEIAAKAAT